MKNPIYRTHKGETAPGYLSYSFMSGSPELWCSKCGSSSSEKVSGTCYNCNVTVVPTPGEPTEIELRDLQIRSLQEMLASSEQFVRVLLEMLVVWERGEKPNWPEKYDSGAEGWLQHRRRDVHEMPFFTQTFWDYDTRYTRAGRFVKRGPGL